jgi:glycerol kinase
VLWNRRSGEPLANAIVWQDRRTAPACEALKQRGLEPLFRQKTGLVLDAYFSGTKVAWLLDNVPGARAAAERGELAFGTVDSWLIWMLTGGADAATRAGAVHATDASNASRTLLFDIHAGAWSDELLAALAIPRQLLPRSIPRATPTAAPSRACSARRSRSAASPATSRVPCSARRASAPARSRTPTAPAASC